MKHYLLLLVLCSMPIFAAAHTLQDFSFIEHVSAQEKDLTEVTLDHFTAPQIVMLWRADCAPCRLEMQHLPTIAHAFPQTDFLVIALDEKQAQSSPLLTHPLPDNVHLLTSSAKTETLFTALGDTRHALPYNAGLRADGSVCKQHYGLLTQDRVRAWIADC